MAHNEENPPGNLVRLPVQMEGVIQGVQASLDGAKDYWEEPDIGERQEAADFDKNRLIRLDKFNVAVWMYVARYLTRFHCRKVKDIQEELLKIFDNYADVKAGKFLVKKLGWRAIPGFGSLVFVVNEVIRFVDIKKHQDQAVAHLRSESSIARTDIIRSIFGQGHGKKTKLVFTRNPGPKQRKPNAGWRSPKP